MSSDTTSILSVIQHYQRSIEKCQTDEPRLLHCIGKLYKLPVKVEHLQETGIGKTVNSLRKFDGEIGAASKALVAKWKAMVASEEEPMATKCHQDDEDDNANGKSGGGGGCDGDSDNNNPSHYDQNASLNGNDCADTSKTQSSSKERVHTSERKHKDEGERSKHSSSRSHHKSSSGNSHANSSSRHKSKSSHDSSGTEPKHAEKQHKSREKDEHEKQKQNDDSERKNMNKSKSSTSSSSSHRNSRTLLKEDNSKSHAEHHSTHSKEKHGDHREHEKRSHSSSKDSKLQKDTVAHKHDKHKSSAKEHDREKKKHNASSSSTAKARESPSTPVASTSERKRRRISDQDSSNDSKSPMPKVAKSNKAPAAEKNDEVVNDDEGIDSTMGANFADVLGMLNMPSKKSKKSLNATKSPSAGASSSSHAKSSNALKEVYTKSSSGSSQINGVKSLTLGSATSTSRSSVSVKPDLLSSSLKLEPLDPSIALELPTISTNYKPMPLNQTVMDCVFASSSSSSYSNAPKAPVRTLTDAEAYHHGISSKTMRTKIYSGVRTGQLMQVPSLFDLCIRVLQKNIDALEYTGGVPFEVLRPVLERATPHQLLVFEEYNPYLMEDSDILWQHHAKRNYRCHKREEMESWREMFLRCQEDQERRLSTLAESIKQSQKIIAAPVRKTQMAFIDTMVKPPRNVQRKQEQFGTKSKLIATPAARVAALSSVTPNAAKSGDARLRVAATVRDNAQISNVARPKKAPLMAKTLQFMRGRHKR